MFLTFTIRYQVETVADLGIYKGDSSLQGGDIHWHEIRKNLHYIVWFGKVRPKKKKSQSLLIKYINKKTRYTLL